MKKCYVREAIDVYLRLKEPVTLVGVQRDACPRSYFHSIRLDYHSVETAGELASASI